MLQGNQLRWYRLKKRGKAWEFRIHISSVTKGGFCKNRDLSRQIKGFFFPNAVKKTVNERQDRDIVLTLCDQRIAHNQVAVHPTWFLEWPLSKTSSDQGKPVSANSHSCLVCLLFCFFVSHSAFADPFWVLQCNFKLSRENNVGCRIYLAHGAMYRRLFSFTDVWALRESGRWSFAGVNIELIPVLFESTSAFDGGVVWNVKPAFRLRHKSKFRIGHTQAEVFCFGRGNVHQAFPEKERKLPYLVSQQKCVFQMPPKIWDWFAYLGNWFLSFKAWGSFQWKNNNFNTKFVFIDEHRVRQGRERYCALRLWVMNLQKQFFDRSQVFCPSLSELVIAPLCNMSVFLCTSRGVKGRDFVVWEHFPCNWLLRWWVFAECRGLKGNEGIITLARCLLFPAWCGECLAFLWAQMCVGVSDFIFGWLVKFPERQLFILEMKEVERMRWICCGVQNAADPSLYITFNDPCINGYSHFFDQNLTVHKPPRLAGLYFLLFARNPISLIYLFVTGSFVGNGSTTKLLSSRREWGDCIRCD